MRSPDFRISCTPANFDKARPSAIRRWTAWLLYQPRFGGTAWRPASNSRSTYMNTTSGYAIYLTTAHRMDVGLRGGSKDKAVRATRIVTELRSGVDFPRDRPNLGLVVQRECQSDGGEGRRRCRWPMGLEQF